MSDAAARLVAMTDALHTDRLLLTPLTLDHLDDYHRVYSDPRTWEHLPTGRHTSRGQSAQAIERSMQSLRTSGFGHCAVVLREPVGALGPGSFVGSAGASMLPFGAWTSATGWRPRRGATASPARRRRSRCRPLAVRSPTPP